MGAVLDARRSDTDVRFARLQQELRKAAQLAKNKACVYATGSFGRGEASKYSDLDLFIIGRGNKDRRKLSNLDEIRIKAYLIEAADKVGLPKFSRDGKYLAHCTERELIETLGRPDDDANNTFTARLLLLLESRPLLGEDIYDEVIGTVIGSYWKDYEGREDEFIPAFLANDILRPWRTFCVNYEAGTSAEPPTKKAKRKLKNYKLKHSRLVTCYSGLLYLLASYAAKGTVHQGDALAMTRLSPTARLEWLLEQRNLSSAHETVRELIRHYERFLADMDFPEEELVGKLVDRQRSRELLGSANKLGDLTFQALEKIGNKSPFLRILVV